MKKLLFFLLLLVSFTLFDIQDLNADTASEARLKRITDSIPAEWWYEGWNKLGELREFISENPDDIASCAKAQRYLGHYYQSKRQYQDAIDEYNKVIELYPSITTECAKAQFEIGDLIICAFNKPEEAIVEYRKVMENYPSNDIAPMCQLMIGKAYMKLGDMKQAEIELQRVIDNYPSAKAQTKEACAYLKDMSEGKGLVNTKGVLTFPDGCRYEGEINDGRMNGKGVLIYPSGSRYEGEFVENNFNGKGKYIWADGDAYEGDYILNKEEGNGILTYNNGDVYEGQFKYGLYHGTGTLYLMCLDDEKPAKSGLWYLGRYLGKEEDDSVSLVPTKSEDLDDEKRIAEILGKSNSSRDDEVDEIFKFADRLFEEGFESKAMVLYEAALLTDSTQLDYQLKLAQIELKKGRLEEAATRAMILYEYAENDEIRSGAKQILDEVSPTGVEMVDFAKEAELEPSIEIVLVPVGNPNRSIIEDVAKNMQMKLGFVIKVEEETMKLPVDKSRDLGAIALNDAVTEMLNEIPEESREKLFVAWGGTREDLNNTEGQRKFITFILQQGEVNDPSSILGAFKPHMQYYADTIIEALRKKYEVRPNDKIKGYIGITSDDIYISDYEFIGYSAQKKYAIASYFHYTGTANSDPQNRNLLVKRLSKVGIAAAFGTIRIPTCSSLYCVHSYSGSVQRRDVLDIDLCAGCRKRLSDYKERMRQ